MSIVASETCKFLWERQISTPHKIDIPEAIDKKFGTVDYVGEGNPLHQIWYKFIHWGLLGKRVKCNKNYFFKFLNFFKAKMTA